MSNDNSGCIGGLAVMAVQVTIFAAWITGIISDAANNRIGWLLADIFVPPIGLVRGLMEWF